MKKLISSVYNQTDLSYDIPSFSDTPQDVDVILKWLDDIVDTGVDSNDEDTGNK